MNELPRLTVCEEPLKFPDIAGKMFCTFAIPAKRMKSPSIGARRTSQSEVNAAGIKRFKGAKLFGDHQRCMVRQHDATRTDADGVRSAGDVSNDDGRCR